MIKVKICGITSQEDALNAVKAGADAIGLQFVEDSARAVSVETAIHIRKVIPPFVSVVGVFKNEHEVNILNVVERVGLDYVQLHGSESPEFVNNLPVKTIKTIGVNRKADLEGLDKYASSAILLDSKIGDQCGGTGKTFNWFLLNEFEKTIPIILAGGLCETNIVEAIKTVKPDVVDLCTGVEITPGIKSYKKMLDFVRIVRCTDWNT
ncbi:phosphoribosylanthranilate isomerase [Cohnella soli]|uniref:N-(5'-phosphoribosyl)anthranilate isomerase n=1 Tax=Cohnella soli TaxID=425005 RepID=A0ABW0HVA3_9BACL